MNSIRNRLVVSLLSVLACAAVAADIVGQQHAKQSTTAAQTAVFSHGATFKDASVPAASEVFSGVAYAASEQAPTF
jgi:hypothetical protein